MFKGDIFTMPISFALQETMKKFENFDNSNDELIYESLKRSKAMWESIQINGLQIHNMTYEQFCDQLEKKKNILFMSDEEVDKFDKAIQIMEILNT